MEKASFLNFQVFNKRAALIKTRVLLYVNQGVGSDNIQLTHEVFYFTYWGHLSEFQQDWNYKYKKVT